MINLCRDERLQPFICRLYEIAHACACEGCLPLSKSAPSVYHVLPRCSQLDKSLPELCHMLMRAAAGVASSPAELAGSCFRKMSSGTCGGLFLDAMLVERHCVADNHPAMTLQMIQLLLAAVLQTAIHDGRAQP